MVGAMALRQLGGLTRRAVLGQNMLRISVSSSNSTSSRFTPVRTFNYSASLARGKLGPLPSFEPTSSPQLDKLLNFLHEELKPTNPSPAANRRTLTDALKLMKSPFDYNAVPGLVLGFAQAKMPIFAHNLEMIVRRLSLAGRIELLLRMLEQAEYNEVRINRKALREALRGFVGQNNHPDKIVAINALRRANRLHKFSNNPRMTVSESDSMKESSGDAPINPEYEKLAPRLYTDPQVTGLLAGMHASTSARFNAGGLDYKGNTAHLINKFLEFYPAIECELNTPLRLNAKKLFTFRRAQVEYAMLLDALRKAEGVLRTTANELLNNPTSEAVATVFPDGVAPPKEQVQAKYKEYNDLAATLRNKIAEIEQKTGKWDESLNEGEKGDSWTKKERTLGPRVYLGEVTETFSRYLRERSSAHAEEEARADAEAEQEEL